MRTHTHSLENTIYKYIINVYVHLFMYRHTCFSYTIIYKDTEGYMYIKHPELFSELLSCVRFYAKCHD